MKTKIALVTIHNAKSYGAVLQTFALQEVLLRHGEVEVINYDNRHIAKSLNLIRFKISIRGFLNMGHDALRLFPRYRLIKKIKYFVKENIRQTKIFSKKDLLHGKLGVYDYYVAGSDQIWNPDTISGNSLLDPIYFLNFAYKGAKKISYASSIGAHEFTAVEKRQIREFLKDFKTISVREKDAQLMLQTILNKPVHHVLDPTLLLSREQWMQRINFKNYISSGLKKYILLYTVSKTPLIRHAANFFSKQMGLKIISLEQSLISVAKVDRQIRDAGIDEFITLFANAEFVITNSFHGVCFAVNFSRPFVAISPGKKINRIESFLSIVGLKERLVSAKDEFDNVKLNSSDLVDAQSKLSAVREHSLTILSQSFSA